VHQFRWVESEDFDSLPFTTKSELRDAYPFGTLAVPLSRGGHAVNLRLELQGPGWRLLPAWNGTNLFTAVPTSVQCRPSAES